MNREMIVPLPTPLGPQITKGCIGIVFVPKCWLLAPKEEDEKERARNEEVLG
jgi:hypothetical protein